MQLCNVYCGGLNAWLGTTWALAMENERANTKKFNSTLNQQKNAIGKNNIYKSITHLLLLACLLPQTNFWHIIMQLWETSGCVVLVVAVFEAFFLL